MVVTSTNIVRDTLFFIKNYLASGVITDPSSSTRPSGEKFIMTSYPQRAVTYPFITVKDLNTQSHMTLGFQSQGAGVIIDMEVRVWANNTKDRDNIADQVFDKMRVNQIGTTTQSQAAGLHDLRLLSSVNVTEPEGNVQSKVQTYRFFYVAE